MAFEIPKQTYSGKIREVTIGTGPKAVTVGGEEVFPFHVFEGNISNPPRIAMEIWDYDPSEEWPKAALEPFKDVVSSPEAWAKKCVEEYGADILVIQLKSTDPNGMDRPAKEAAELVKKIVDAVDVPVVVWGTANNQKDEEVLRAIAEICEGKNIALAPVEEGNHKGVGASALAFSHIVVASTPIDVNLAKQLNILLENLGVSLDKIIIDPTTGGLGYGLEYSYSVMERIKLAALTQQDDKLQSPLINNLGNEVWKCKEAGQDIDEAPTLGDPERRAILMEVTAAVCYLLAGSNVVILRHPESVRLVRSFIDLMINGGSAKEIQGVNKLLEEKEVDLLSLAPEPKLEFEAPEEEKKAAPPKKEAAPKVEEKKVEEKAEEKVEEKKEEAVVKEAAPKVEEKKEEKVEEKAEKKVEEKVEEKKEEKVISIEEARAKEEEEKKRAEEEAKRKAEEEAKRKAEEEAKKKAEEERRRAEEEAKRKAEEEARRKAEEEERERREKEWEELLELRRKREEEKARLLAEREAQAMKEVKKTPAKEQLDLVDKIIRNLDRIHRRNR